MFILQVLTNERDLYLILHLDYLFILILEAVPLCTEMTISDIKPVPLVDAPSASALVYTVVGYITRARICSELG